MVHSSEVLETLENVLYSDVTKCQEKDACMFLTLPPGPGECGDVHSL